uniref:leucine-rich repeat receptor protein kinase EXS-like n=1 Tax=Fragaria vesca subsp. vesca TaxID=101020 RepID=UPI0005C7F893|nr:PREDICTED: leucine-rich repeat receptor protein kinase EXS-like [Fragaria vesca subsp. vesca]
MGNYILFLLLCQYLLIASEHCSGEELPGGAKCIDEERRVLLTFKHHLTDPSGRLSSWSSGDDCCQWNGLSCDNQTGHIVKMDLRNPYPYRIYNDEWDFKDYQQSCLSGEIPHFLGNLSNLNYLDLDNSRPSNSLDENLSKNLNWLSRLSSLKYLNLGRANLGGAGVSWLHYINMLPSLLELHLSACGIDSNQLPLLLPTVNFTSLSVLDMSENSFNSSIPSWISNLTSLSTLDLHGNYFASPIPNEFANLKNLEHLDLSFNYLDGQIPEVLGQLSQLVVLDLSQNFWEGTLTESHFKSLTKLDSFAVSTDRPMPLIFNVTYDKLPPFKLHDISIVNCLVGDAFAVWLQSQTELSDVMLSGTGLSEIPEEWLLKISSQVEYLHFTDNQIQGPLPFHSKFPKLFRLDLSRNRFSKSIPLDFGQLMPNLRLLYLSDNYLVGTIPSSIYEIPLWSIYLRNNQLSGEFPQAWSLWSEIDVVDVSRNNLSGNIPSSMGIPSSLAILKMNNNNFGGKIPSFRNCSELSRLALGGNKFSGNLPSWIGSMVTLRMLQLRTNSFSGHIPHHLCNLIGLHVLDLAQNNFSGTIPKCLDNITSMGSEPSGWPVYDYAEQTTIISKGRELEYGVYNAGLVKSIDLSSNNLEGEIPDEITSLIALGTLNLSRNHLHGNIPSNIGNLSSLETLDLSHNHLFGEIPQSLSSLNYLSHLNLSCNNFSGRIPSGNQLRTLVDPSIYEGNPSLCGFPLSTKCPGDDEPTSTGNLPVQNNDDEDGNEKLGLYISVTLGFIIGFWGVCGTLVVKKSLRHAYFQFFNNIKENIIVAIAVKVARLRGHH